MITIVTDTSVGYSRAELSSRNVKMVSLNYSISGINFSENCRGENGNFFKAMQGKLVKTSQPSPYDFTQIFKQIAETGSEVLCITISSALSGTYSSALLAAREFGDKVKVIDSQSTNGGLHLLVDEAVNMVVGGMPMQKIITCLEELKKKINTVFSVETLEPLRKGGRLVVNQAPSTTLNSRPILKCDGGITFISNVRGTKARISALVSVVPFDARRIFVMKSGDDTVTAPLEAALSAKFPSVKIHLRVVGPVLTAHLGGGAMGIAYISK